MNHTKMYKEPTFMVSSYTKVYFVVNDSDREILSIHTALQSAMKHCDELKIHEPECYVYSLELGDYA